MDQGGIEWYYYALVVGVAVGAVYYMKHMKDKH
jgi:hypothetical protein